MRDLGEWTAIVVAGDKGKSHPVFGKNKAFLEVHGVPVVRRVVSALDRSRSVSEIYVVGPRQRLEEALHGSYAGIEEIGKPLHIFEQRANLFENVWYTFLETLPSYKRGESVEDIARGPDADRAVLVAAADMPLLTSAEVDEFASNCDKNSYDHVIGVTREKDLTPYYAKGDQPGIHLAYIHLREGSLRQNNLQMVRPFKVINRHYIQILYDLRYQKEFGNMVRLAWEILNKEEGGWGTLGNYALMQLSLFFARLRLNFLRDFFRKRTRIDSVIECLAKLMKTRLTVAYTSLGGAALDIDCDQEYEVIERRFSEWMAYQENKAKEILKT